MDGLELLAEAKRIASYLIVLAMTGFGDVPMAVRAVRIGAWDLLEKPVGTESLLHAADAALARMASSNPHVGRSLTKTEMRILDLILAGKTNREISNILSRSIKTIEVHRSHIMRKFDVDNVVDLTKRAFELGLIDV